MPQFAVPCSVYRGGTSRGLFFLKDDLPKDVNERNRIFMEGIDAYNPSQINGLGSGTSHTSKVCVISPSSKKDCHIDFTFYQIGIGEEVVDDNGTCGNLMSAVGAFAVDEKMVDVSKDKDSAVVMVNNTNIGKTLRIVVPVKDGVAEPVGSYVMPGVVKPGSPISISILEPGGGKTGKTQPLGSLSTLSFGGKEYAFSFTDVINPFLFVSAAEFNLDGDEPYSEVAADLNLIEELNLLRDHVTVMAGMAENPEKARRITPSIPKISLVAAPRDYKTTSGKTVNKQEVDIIAKMLSMGRLHRTFAASGLYNLAATVLLPGTIPNKLSGTGSEVFEKTVRIGHADGIAEVKASVREDGLDVLSVGMDRTARRIMRGDLYIPCT